MPEVDCDWHVPFKFEPSPRECTKDALLYVEPKAPSLRPLLERGCRDLPHAVRRQQIPVVALHPYG